MPFVKNKEIMILSVGEILVDMMGHKNTYTMHVGGAPFNVAVGAKRCGATVAFVGKVGDDVPGKFIQANLDSFGLDRVDVKVDKVRNTTLAFVAHDESGERDFAFFRHDTADYQLTIDDVDFDGYPSLNILHVGTLMLSEECGRSFATQLIDKAESRGVKVSIDANFRDDLYDSKASRNAIFKPYLERADILKLSADELVEFTGESDIFDAVKKLGFKDLLFVTDGANGSYVFTKDGSAFVPTEETSVVDTTGAGDAYYGAILAGVDHLILNNECPDTINLIPIAEIANSKGAETASKLGAI